jgi:class 3 adenylate cyclase/tetratricopeptide (TPR) repeat protein
MHCAKCGSDNREGRKFCAKCGAALARQCPRCGTSNDPGDDFCGECGAGFDSPVGIPAAESSLAAKSETVGERRHLTVLLCDLVGSTAIAAQLDPEEWRETVAGCLRAAAEEIRRFDGYVMKFLGDGVMALFGWPAAHDDDAERAVRAGLAILGAIVTLNEQPGRTQLSGRVGIDSGTVVVGNGAGDEIDVFGDTPNIAARVESAADSGTVAITEATQRLVSGLFIVEERGAQELKGVERPLQLYRVIRPSGARRRFDVATATGGLTRFVGREDELRLLTSRWERALDGEGQVALIIGEAGIGKSRLVQRFHEQIAGTSHTWVEAGAGAFYQNTPFYPVAEMLRQFVGDGPAENQLEQLATRLAVAGLNPAEAIPLIAPLLNLALPPEYPPSALSPDQQRRRLLATLVEWVPGSARGQPLVIVVEDLHWADPSTLEVIQLLVEQGASARLLLLYTARPEFHPPWPMRPNHLQINLNRLTASNVRTIVAQVAARIALSHETVAAVVERTGGVPLFVEELTRAVLERGDAKLSGREIPATLHDSLMARLDRLGPAKEVIQVGAVIGSEFSYELLQAVHPIGEVELQQALNRLTDAELLYVRGIAPDATYQFKHALIRDAAYEALLKTRRKELHLLVARTIDEKFPALKEIHPEVLARHWTEAGTIESAIAEWQRAGERAVERRAYREAEQHYREAREALRTLPESPELNRRELALQVALGDVMQWTRGWSAAMTIEAYTRAGVLADRSGGADSIKILGELCTGASLRGEPHAALALAHQMLVIADRGDSSLALITAHSAAAFARLQLGHLAEARQLYRQVMEYYREDEFHSEPMANDGFYARIFAGHTEWFLGYPEKAVRLVAEALSIARRQNNPFLTAFALAVGSFVYELRRDYRRSFEAGNEAVHLDVAAELPFINAIGRDRSAWARAQMGDTSGAVDQIQAGLTELNGINFYASRASVLVELAETQAAAGSHDEALVTVEQAVHTNPDELIYRPAVLRLRGELRLQNSSGNAHFELAEQDFRESIDLTQQISAKSLELRATTSLARLLDNTGRQAEARTMLTDIYNCFTEGFDTADLKDAKALLDQLTN